MDLTVLDVSSAALNYAKERLGSRFANVAWTETDVTEFVLATEYDLWHDRSIFHFLTDPQDRKRYIKVINEGLKSGDHLIIAAFALEGPPKCSDLDVERYSSGKIRNELGDSFKLVQSVDELHITPGGKEQKFTYCLFKKT